MDRELIPGEHQIQLKSNQNENHSGLHVVSCFPDNFQIDLISFQKYHFASV